MELFFLEFHDKGTTYLYVTYKSNYLQIVDSILITLKTKVFWKYFQYTAGNMKCPKCTLRRIFSCDGAKWHFGHIIKILLSDYENGKNQDKILKISVILVKFALTRVIAGESGSDSMMMIKHWSDSIESKSIETKFVNPPTKIWKQKSKNFPMTIIKKTAAPCSVMTSTATMKITRIWTVEFIQTICNVWGCMRMDNI